MEAIASALPVDVERETIVAALIYDECGAVFAELMRPEYFSDSRYAAVAGEIIEHLKSGDGFDPATAARNLKTHPAFPGGNDDVVSLVRDLTGEYASRAQFPSKCTQIVEASRKRDYLVDLHKLQYMARNGESSNEIYHATLAMLSRWQQAASGFGENGPMLFSELRTRYPSLRPPVIDHLAREGETLNIISDTKVGKSWLCYLLALCVVVGRMFLDRFPTRRGKVLIIDNELHRETLVYRIREVANALGLDPRDYESQLVVWCLRGKRMTVDDIAAELLQFKPGEYSLILWDSKYRVQRPGTAENSNDDQRDLHNLFDEIGAHTLAVQGMIHHSSKGDQSGKKTTDVGSGGGAQSRAVDTHLILRPHEEEGLFVADCALRSFAPIESFALRWDFPLWTLDHTADPARLKRPPTGNQVRQEAEDRKGMEQIIKALRGCPSTARKLRESTAIGKDRMERLLGLMAAAGHVTTKTITVRGNGCHEYTLAE